MLPVASNKGKIFRRQNFAYLPQRTTPQWRAWCEHARPKNIFFKNQPKILGTEIDVKIAFLVVKYNNFGNSPVLKETIRNCNV